MYGKISRKVITLCRLSIKKNRGVSKPNAGHWQKYYISVAELFSDFFLPVDFIQTRKGFKHQLELYMEQILTNVADNNFKTDFKPCPKRELGKIFVVLDKKKIWRINKNLQILEPLEFRDSVAV